MVDVHCGFQHPTIDEELTVSLYKNTPGGVLLSALSTEEIDNEIDNVVYLDL